MKYEDYYRARLVLEDFLRQDLVGPVKQDESFGDIDPLKYYAMGILFPQGYNLEQEEMTQQDFVDPNDRAINLCNSANPSSMAVSFTVRHDVQHFYVKSKFAWYTATRKEKPRKGEHPYIWKRQFHENVVQINLMDDLIHPEPVHDGLEVQVYLQKTYKDGSKTFTVALVNKNRAKRDIRKDNEMSYFQNELFVYGDQEQSETFIEKQLRVDLKRDREVLNLEMLYRHNKTFAVGHGCSVDWESSGSYASLIHTEVLPTYELRQMKPEYPVGRDLLSWKFLGYGEKDEITSRLHDLTNAYDEWITRLRQEEVPNVPEKYKKELGTEVSIAEENLQKCEETLERLRNGIRALADNDNQYVFQAFQFANRAMLAQREQTLKSKGEVYDAEALGWYPFQLAFLLQEICSIVNPEDNYRDIVDLLWFPTGGGKTEAYLGLAAFTIFYRRFLACKEGRNGAGVTILMRYTLRLLTFQQFERASAMICACEVIRRQEESVLGTEEISIGLWVGELTPNKRDQARKALLKIQADGVESLGEDDSNPCQVLGCPWCGTEIKSVDYKVTTHRMEIRCPNKMCDFHKALPLYLIDEDVYDHRPTLILGTVDKFARMTWEPRVGEIFGINSDVRPPELIIQDELHLISGPLGTITGLYEVAIDMLCSQYNIKPKIVASTATIRNAENQVMSLYGRDYRQFPPQGLDIRDSFFAKESDPANKPSRKYVGIMGPGKSATTMLVRIFAVMLFATRYLKDLGYSDSIVDSFWTMTGYFNNLRQLGGAVVHIVDDVQARFSYLYDTKFQHVTPGFSQKRPFVNYDELTSRKASSEISQVLKNLDIRYPNLKAFDFIMASNMISVGVDVGRLGLMFVNGQPKSNAEYIQATSRVGRQSPGFVIVLQDSSRSRDRSHYEQFISYHASMYKYVEATSLTPFSARARDRALHAVLISLCRQLVRELRYEADNIGLARDKVETFVEYILGKVQVIDSKEVEATRQDLTGILETWQNLAGGDLEYTKHWAQHDKKALLKNMNSPEYEGYPTLNSMRSVDTESVVYVEGR